MKIKEVCIQTGLTDKAIRTYIRSGLVFPKYNENYTGRKNWSFSEEDIKRLHYICILRKYDFSLKEIKSLYDGDISTEALLNNHIRDIKDAVDKDIGIVNAMMRISHEVPADADEFCEKLNQPQVSVMALPPADNDAPYKLLYRNEKRTNMVISVFLTIAILIIALCGAFIYHLSKAPEATRISYQNNHFSSNISEAYRFDNVWYPLSEADIEATGYLHFENESVSPKDAVKIQCFSDASLQMFLMYHALGEDNLYGNVDYDFPNYMQLDHLEEIVIRQDYQGDWKDAYNDGKVTVISDEARLNHFKSAMNKIYGNSKEKLYPLPGDTNAVGHEVGLKFKGINAIYYLGMLAQKDGDEYYFYNANTQGSELYLITI